MTKFEMIEEIRRLNYTASIEFLSQFDELELREYIEHLHQIDSIDLTAAMPACVPFN